MMMVSNPTINVDDIAQTIGVSKPTTKREILTLRKDGVIDREGSKKRGKWIVIKKT